MRPTSLPRRSARHSPLQLLEQMKHSSYPIVDLGGKEYALEGSSEGLNLDVVPPAELLQPTQRRLHDAHVSA